MQRMNAEELLDQTDDRIELPEFDDVSFPMHYAGDGSVTCEDALASMMSNPKLPPENHAMYYWWGCAFKYLWRCLLKGDPHKDLAKAKQCIDEMLDRL